jgi:hypothetical protein
MTTDRNSLQKRTTFKSLDKDLRALPKPVVPESLEEKLLASIPHVKPMHATNRKIYWSCIAGFVGLAAMIPLALILRSNNNAISQPPALPGSLNNTSPRYILGNTTISANTKETRPWDIIPPFPDGH